MTGWLTMTRRFISLAASVSLSSGIIWPSDERSQDIVLRVEEQYLAFFGQRLFFDPQNYVSRTRKLRTIKQFHHLKHINCIFENIRQEFNTRIGVRINVYRQF